MVFPPMNHGPPWEVTEAASLPAQRRSHAAGRGAESGAPAARAARAAQPRHRCDAGCFNRWDYA